MTGDLNICRIFGEFCRATPLCVSLLRLLLCVFAHQFKWSNFGFFLRSGRGAGRHSVLKCIRCPYAAKICLDQLWTVSVKWSLQDYMKFHSALPLRIYFLVYPGHSYLIFTISSYAIACKESFHPLAVPPAILSVVVHLL